MTLDGMGLGLVVLVSLRFYLFLVYVQCVSATFLGSNHEVLKFTSHSDFYLSRAKTEENTEKLQ